MNTAPDPCPGPRTQPPVSFTKVLPASSISLPQASSTAQSAALSISLPLASPTTQPPGVSTLPPTDKLEKWNYVDAYHTHFLIPIDRSHTHTHKLSLSFDVVDMDTNL